ncbi:MAG: hypothetical protein H0T62_13895 [Parachlamydiaceae bacterium]|nr:hypothetical protein [Parachlamydiaceae bacterium]
MKNLVTKLALAVATASSSYTGAINADLYGFEIGVGYRQDSILWKMEDHGAVAPHVESDLHFKDLEIVVLGARFKGLLGESFYSRASFDYGWIVDGTLREELNIENRHDTTHFDHNGVFTDGRYSKAVVHNRESGNSYVWDFNLAFGVPYQFGCEGLQIAPMIGFSYDRQHIKIRNKENLWAHPDRHFSSIETGDHAHNNCKSKSTFKTSWWGPWIGFDLSYVSDNCWTFFGEFELHGGRVERDRNSSIGVSFFDRYDRTKCFWGTTTRLGTNYVLCDNWYLEGAISFSHWCSTSHRDDLYWSSGGVRIDAGYLF